MLFDDSYRRILYKLGYYNYQHGFILRHINQEAGWNSHLEKCRNFIIKALEIHKPEKVTVLGSGWILELPLGEMLEKVKNVCLIDIIHPPEVRNQIGNLKGVELRTEDISGGLIEEVWQKTSGFSFHRKRRSVDDIIIPEYKFDTDPGMVISLNILTQLEILPVKYLLKKTKVEEIDLIRFRKEIQNNHLNMLKKHKSVLITDINEIFTDSSGKKSENPSVIINLPDGQFKEKWIWDFDLKGSDYYGKRSIFEVEAIII
jgi:hypothetical protein